jgi:cytochrome P450
VAANYGEKAGTDEAVADGLDVYRDFSKYFYPRITADEDPSHDGLLSVLTRSKNEENLSLTEALMFLWVLLAAGNETTRQLIGNTVVALYENPDQLELLLDRPDLIPGTIEESLRYYPPIRNSIRGALEATTVGGVDIPEGARVMGMLAAANRDPSVFENPDRFDITRNASSHVSLGHGIHYCLGAHLAKIEGQIALAGLLPHLAEFRLPAAPELLPVWLIHGYQSIDLVRT